MLPWENEGGVVYTARELRPRKRWVTYGGYCFAALLLAAGILTRFRIALLFGALYILALLMEKHVVVSEEGIEQFYQMHITTHYECYPWNEIDTVLLEDRGIPHSKPYIFGAATRQSGFSLTRRTPKKSSCSPANRIPRYA